MTGVAKNPPVNTHLRFDFIGSYVSVPWAVKRRWESANYFTFIVIKDDTNIEASQRKLDATVEREMGPFDGANSVKMSFIPLNDIHLKSTIARELYKGDITYVYIFSFIAALILVIACVNYMNLATARSVLRAREVGMRKVMGAYRTQLFFQFIGESSLITAAAIIMTIVIVVMSLPQFAELAGRPLDSGLLVDPYFLVGLVALWLLISFIAGTYPAIVLSSYSPGKVLKSSFKYSSKGATLRKILVVFQFAVSVFLLIGSVIIYQQLNYMQNKKLGYDKSNLVILPADQTTKESFMSFKTELLRLPEVSNAAMANESLSQVNGGYGLKVEGI